MEGVLNRDSDRFRREISGPFPEFSKRKIGKKNE